MQKHQPGHTSQVCRWGRGYHGESPEQRHPLPLFLSTPRVQGWHSSSQLIPTMSLWGRWYPHFVSEKHWGAERFSNLCSITEQVNDRPGFNLLFLLVKPRTLIQSTTLLPPDLQCSSNGEREFLGTKKTLPSGDPFKSVCYGMSAGSMRTKNKYLDGRGLWKLSGHAWKMLQELSRPGRTPTLLKLLGGHSAHR